MKLFFRKYGEGQPIIIIHGLFGQSDNWNVFGKQFAEKGFSVYLVDARNHGLSPHNDEWNYQAMSDDILELINDNNLSDVIVLGHSMGGKIAMQFALQHPNLLSKLIVADIAPRYYPPHHQVIIEALNAVDLKAIKTRSEAEAVLSKYIHDFGTKQFLLKNLFWQDNLNDAAKSAFAWRFNLPVIERNILKIGQEITSDTACTTPSLFIRGAKSEYVSNDDFESIKELFPYSIIETLDGAGHWVHVDKPKEFFNLASGFIR